MAVPLVSVVIPSYNSARTLVATVQSALAQTVSDLEVIIVDDGSRDDTLAVAHAIQDPRVKVLTQANGGAAAARNTGISAATGKYVALLDADDLWLPYKLQRQLEILEGGRGVLAVQSGAVFVDDELKVLSVRPCFQSHNPLLETLLFQNMPSNMSTLVIARHCFAKIGSFDVGLEILEEWDMAIKVARHCNLVSVEEPLALYRVHLGNRSRNIDIHIAPGLLVLQRLFAEPSLPLEVRCQRRRIYGAFYRMLAGGYFNSKQYSAFARWAAKSLAQDPAQVIYMGGLPLRRLARYMSRHTADDRHFRTSFPSEAENS